MMMKNGCAIFMLGNMRKIVKAYGNFSSLRGANDTPTPSLRGANASERRSNLDALRLVRSVFRHSLQYVAKVRARMVKHYSYESVDTFLAQDCYADGIHEISVEQGVTLDILIFKKPWDIPSSSRIPVFFSGALTDRENTNPPYFSGRSFARRLGQGIIAISDPIFYYDEKITAGWYTGLPNWHTQSAITRILEKFTSLYKRDILCVGGSAGGFAALEAASTVRGAAAFVWNAQTSILDYLPFHIRIWMDLLFGEDWIKGEASWRHAAERLLADTDIVHNLHTLPLPEALFYLQNDTDWHVDAQMHPYVAAHEMHEVEDGVFQGTSRQVIALKHFGDGHARLPLELVVSTVREMTNKNSSSYEVYKNLFPSLLK